MGRVYNPKDEAWTNVERRGAVNVTSHVLVPLEDGGRTRLSLTRIEAGSTFGPHVDDYEHVFCVREGTGEVMIGRTRQKIGPGDVITTKINEAHGLWADDEADLVLVAANIYPSATTTSSQRSSGTGRA